MLQGQATSVINDLVGRLKKLLDNPDSLAWMWEKGRNSIWIPTDLPIVQDFLSSDKHFFPLREGIAGFFNLPNGWFHIRVRDRFSPFARAIAVIDNYDKVRLIVMFDRDNKPAPVEIFDP